MAKITSSGPNTLPKLKELVNLTKDIRNNNSTAKLETKMDRLIEAIEEMTSR